MEPALGREEWGDVLGSAYPPEQHIHGHLDDRPHRVAALCLHGQEYGFTREDVKMLRQGPVWLLTPFRIRPQLEALADRISALLPPE